MKVLSLHYVKGRGLVTNVDLIPPHLGVGTIVHVACSLERRYRVCGIEVLAKFLGKREHDVPAGLLLKNANLDSQDKCMCRYCQPGIGEELEIDP
jgi:hypothetical protein